MPKDDGGNEALPVGSRVLADWLGISQQAVSKHTRDGVLQKGKAGYDLKASIRAYCSHVRAVAAGRGGQGEVVTLANERARLAREMADAHALKNALMRGELVELAVAEREWSGVLRSVRSAMLAVPSRVRQRLGHLTAADVAVLEEEVRAALTEAARDNSACGVP